MGIYSILTTYLRGPLTSYHKSVLILKPQQKPYGTP